MIRRGGVTDIPWILLRLEISVSYLFNTSPRFNYGSDISQLRVLASHNTSLGSVAQGALELESWEIRRYHFLSDPCVIGYIF